jgi:hypothetical protein
MKKLIAVLFGIIFPFSNIAFADSEEHGAMVALKAFQCFQYANYTKEGAFEKKNKEWLFERGLTGARTFLKYLNENPEKTNEILDKAPWIFRTFSGPTGDFVIGRWFQFAVDDAYEKIVNNIKDDKFKFEAEFQANAARKLYFDTSCDVIGR